MGILKIFMRHATKTLRKELRKLGMWEGELKDGGGTEVDFG